MILFFILNNQITPPLSCFKILVARIMTINVLYNNITH